MRNRLTLAAYLLAGFVIFVPVQRVAAQTLPIVLSDTVQLNQGQSRDLTVNLTAGVTYYFVAAPYIGTGYNNADDAMQYIYNPSGALVASNDDWGSYASLWDPALIGPTPTNGWASFIVYTPTTSGNFKLTIRHYPWGVAVFNPFPITVYGGTPTTPPSGPGPGPGPGTGGPGIPNVKLHLHASPMFANLSLEGRPYPQVEVVASNQREHYWIAAPGRNQRAA